MPNYIVRWQNGTVTLCNARNRDEMAILVDEWGNADDAEVTVWAGPMATQPKAEKQQEGMSRPRNAHRHGSQKSGAMRRAPGHLPQ